MEENARSLDVAQVASTDLVALNNTVVNMRGSVKSAKVQVINKLVRNIRKLKTKNGSEEQKQKYLRKAERQLEEVFAIKALKPDKVSKFALANKLSFDEICKQKNTSTELRSMARLAYHKQVAKKVAEFRAQHDDWPALAAYLLVKQTGRRFKSTKQKEKARKKAPANITAARTATHSYLTSKLGASEKIDKLLTGPRPKKGQLKNSSTEQAEKYSKQNAAERDSGVDDDSDVNRDENAGGQVESDESEEASGNDVSGGEEDDENQSEAENEENDSEDSENDAEVVNRVDGDAKGRPDAGRPHSKNTLREKMIALAEGKNSVSGGDSDDGSAKGRPTAGCSQRKKTLRERMIALAEDKNPDSEEESDDSVENLGKEEDDASSDEESFDDQENNRKSILGVSDSNVESSDEDSSVVRKTKLLQIKKSKKETPAQPKKKKNTHPSAKDKEKTGEMVVKYLDLNSADSDIFADSPGGGVPDILLEEPSSKSKMAKDPFFLGSEGDSDNQPSDDEDNYTSFKRFHRDSDDETQQDREERTLQAGRLAVESTFLNSLDGTGSDWRERKFGGRGRGVGGDRRGRGGRGSFRGQGKGGFEDRKGGFRGRGRDIKYQGRGGFEDHKGGFRGRGRGHDFRGRGRGRGMGRDNSDDSTRGGRGGPAKKSFQMSKQIDTRGSFKAQPAAKHTGGSQQEKVHPSWEASQKRKLQEQQTTFQGKRIKFDD